MGFESYGQKADKLFVLDGIAVYAGLNLELSNDLAIALEFPNMTWEGSIGVFTL